MGKLVENQFFRSIIVDSDSPLTNDPIVELKVPDGDLVRLIVASNQATFTADAYNRDLQAATAFIAPENHGGFVSVKVLPSEIRVSKLKIGDPIALTGNWPNAEVADVGTSFTLNGNFKGAITEINNDFIVTDIVNQAGFAHTGDGTISLDATTAVRAMALVMTQLAGTSNAAILVDGIGKPFVNQDGKHGDQRRQALYIEVNVTGDYHFAVGVRLPDFMGS